MSRGHVNLTSRRRKVYLIVLVQLHLLAVTARGCILLLNGWDPVPLAERTSLAPVVAAAIIRRTFRNLKTGQVTCFGDKGRGVCDVV